MNTLFIILAVLALVGSVLITLIVLLQNSKGGGLASNFTAGNQTFGVRQTTDILEKITWGLAIFILAVSIIASFTYKSDKAGYADEATEQPQESNPPVPNTLMPNTQVSTDQVALDQVVSAQVISAQDSAAVFN